MIEKLFTLLERFVVAFEAIAAEHQVALITAHHSGPEAPCACANVVLGSTAPQPEEAKVEPDPVAGPPTYTAWDRGALIAECEKRGIPVEPRVRAATLASRLEEYDKGWRPAPPAEEPDPLPDPLSDIQTEPPAAEAPKLTIDEVKIVLRRLMKYKDTGYKQVPGELSPGTRAVSELIRKHAGVDRIVMVTQDHFQAIVDEAEQMMGGGA